MKTQLYFGLILLQFFLVYEITNAQSDTVVWAWAKSLSATNGIYGHAIAIDPDGSGDIYLAGGFEGTTDFDPGPGTFKLSTSSPGNVSIFIAKYDGSGIFIWAKAMIEEPGSGGSAYSIALDPTGSGTSYITGRFEGTIDFDPGPNEFNLTSYGDNDIFVSKFDSAGNFVWAKAMGGPGQDFANSIAQDPGGDGSIYTTGQFWGSVDFDPGDDTFNLTSAGSYDVFISKLDGDGNFAWAKKLGGPGNDVGRAIAFDPEGSGKVYSTGQFYGTVDFDPGTDNTDTFYLTSAVLQENFLSKLDESGNFLWAKQMGRINLGPFDRYGSIALDPAGSGEVYITGPFIGTGDFDPGDGIDSLTSKGDLDIFISKITENGEFKWAEAIGGPLKDECIDIAIAIDDEGNRNVFTLGMFKGTADFDPGPDSFKLTAEGELDLFISNLDNEGNFLWVKEVKGAANAYGQCLVADNQSAYASGAFFGTAISFDSTTLTNVGISEPDLFMAKLDFSVATNDLNNEAQKINLYPNPALDELTIEIDGKDFFNVDITLLNTLGEVVYFIPNESIIQKKSIDISALTPGIYFVELNIDGNKVVGKVVKE